MNQPANDSTEDLVEASLHVLARVEDFSSSLRAAELSDWRSISPAHADALDQAIAEWHLFSNIEPGPLSMPERVQLAGQIAWTSAVDHPTRTGVGLCALLVLAIAPFYLWAEFGNARQAFDLTQISSSLQHTVHHDQKAIRYSTVRGEQEFITLPDGSNLWLNWNSEVLVASLEDEIHVDVLRGDVLFSVPETKGPMLVIHAGDAVSYAPNTEFAIHSHTPKDAFFQVREGIVTIVSENSTAAVQLAATEQVYFESGRGTAPSPANFSSIAAWREGKLIFDKRPLVEVLYELAHYTEQPFQVGHVIDPGERISATIYLVDADQALAQLADQYRLEIFRPTPEDLIVRSIDSRRL